MSSSNLQFIFMSSYCCVLYFAGSGVKNVQVGLSVFRMRLFVFGFAMFLSVCVDVMVMSSAYVASFTGKQTHNTMCFLKLFRYYFSHKDY